MVEMNMFNNPITNVNSQSVVNRKNNTSFSYPQQTSSDVDVNVPSMRTKSRQHTGALRA